MTRLTPVTFDANNGLARLLSPILDEPITEIWYRPAGEKPPAVPAARWSGAVHDVQIDAKIFTVRHALTISWARDHLIEGLALTVEDLPAPCVPEEEWCSVGDLAEWRPSLGHSISGFSAAWHGFKLDDVPALWSIRLTDDAGRNYVFALGEIDRSDELSYIPDGILAIFDEQVSRRYRIWWSSSVSSWGTAVSTSL